MVKTVNDARVAVVSGDFQSLSAQDIKDADSSYCGAQLIFTGLPENCSTEVIEKMVYTIVICSVEQIDSVKSGLLKCYDSTEVAYAYDKSAQPDKQTDGLLTPAVKGIVVGHWSQDGQLSHKQINQGHHNLFGCSEGDDSLQRELIETFSHDASTIIDATQSGSMHGCCQPEKKSCCNLYRCQPSARVF
ncbi:uncharacterized protein LOC135341587 isoform X1 [Halichondria panicea]|uniref:uncharacterized protein LOC135341587 isoform X1 n=1 Tax=Halichondria panicea TaxID=6063 RepID=UPI00312B3415